MGSTADGGPGAPALGGPGSARAVHLPGDPTPVADPVRGPVRGCTAAIGGFLGELLGELVLGTLFALLTTASLAGVFVLAELVHRRDPLLARAMGAAAVLLLFLGVRQLRRPREQRGRVGRILAAGTAGLGVWLLACVGYASLREALDLATF
ncbi:hypothetical protein SAMN05216371_2190 [Streptomyces sp. TLI_053]|uniref:hypothetical protein n=1 Tax=Streptomyces sp. TLI_053 TaxID=1855352 RepID=UPI000879A281|nr:hypothetical protein [Streptomyces sp. TLI_053]SDT40840.1 hypothetical protein SAMN05216371_2190 [Streptomyces sp. TLI_053]